jgi:hypothetical protein
MTSAMLLKKAYFAGIGTGGSQRFADGRDEAWGFPSPLPGLFDAMGLVRLAKIEASLFIALELLIALPPN